MRIWSLHPSYLDAKGLVALWRETLLAKHVLEGKTKGYTRHPQLTRFRDAAKPLERVNQYLASVYDEAVSRGYSFNKDKIDWNFGEEILFVNSGQLAYEKEHLLQKLHVRDIEKYHFLQQEPRILPHPLFSIIPGKIEDWEIMITKET